MTEAPKRILALSGGGVRGIVEVAFLEAVEQHYRERLGPRTQLCDVFDLVGGTSTGALIAAAVALGRPVEQIKDFYLNRAAKFFADRKWWRIGRAPIFDCAGLEAEIRADIGDVTLGDKALRTLLAIVTKRLDTGAPWIVNNIPSAPYFDDPDDGGFVGNRHYDLVSLLRAATSAPTYFSPQRIRISNSGETGLFVDGGLSPYNDPSLALLMLARMKAFGLNWNTGPDNLFVLSLGSGRFRARMPVAEDGAINPLRLAYRAMMGAIGDTEQHSLTMMEWMGVSDAPSHINSEVPTLGAETLFSDPLFQFLRLDLPLDDPSLDPKLRRMDDPTNIAPLYDMAKAHIATHDLSTLLR